MYHHLRNQTPVAAFISLVTFALSLQLTTMTAAKAVQTTSLAGSVSAQFRLPPNVKQIKKKPVIVEMYQFDEAPLGSRQPLLLVHGLRGELWKDCFRWQQLCTYLTQDNEFNKRYKIYLARYDSYLPLGQLREQFQQAFLKFAADTGDRPVSIICLSLGGNVVADAMSDPKIDAHVDHVLTMGTPFHGSPLFSSSWMEYTILKTHISPVAQIDVCLPYQIYFGKHRNLLDDLNWDNSDKMLPTIERYRLWYNPLRARAISPGVNGNHSVFKWNEAQVDKKKFTVYAGYLETPVADGGAVSKRFKNPMSWFVGTIIPMHAGKEHPVLRSLNRQMTAAITAGGTRQGNGAYALNDGITPLASSLFLSNPKMDDGIVKQVNLAKLAEHVDVRRARVFKNIDHLTFIDDYHPKGAARDLVDELSDSNTSKPIFAWVLHDLLSPSKLDISQSN
jgi:hypothetical protein